MNITILHKNVRVEGEDSCSKYQHTRSQKKRISYTKDVVAFLQQLLLKAQVLGTSFTEVKSPLKVVGLCFNLQKEDMVFHPES